MISKLSLASAAALLAISSGAVAAGPTDPQIAHIAYTAGSIDIAAGKQADLAVWHIESLTELGYWVGLPGPERRIYGGHDA